MELCAVYLRDDSLDTGTDVWELIISDDCSTDNTREVIAPLMEADSRIKYICNERNSGAAITRNNALKVA